ncbi:TPA: hypothetical protein ACH3X1_000296 [Trebouxia sp. C0004]
MQASPASRARPSSDLLDPQPAWMAPSSGHRPHWAQRQQQQQTQQQQPARQPKRLPSDRAANDDTVDVLGVPVSHLQLSAEKEGVLGGLIEPPQGLQGAPSSRE